MESGVSVDSVGSKGELVVGDESYEIFRLSAVEGSARLPFSLKVLLENLLRTEDGANITADHIRALGGWDSAAEPDTEIQFTPARVIMQDFTGVPCVVDLATMREAVRDLGGDPAKINPLAPAELVIDHSVVADLFGVADAFARNVELEYERNFERYQFLRWGQTRVRRVQGRPARHRHRPPGQHRAPGAGRDGAADGQAYPDTCVGTDSHTTMVNGLGVLAWGVGGIEAESALLGQPVSMLIPRVVGFKLHGELPEGATATDLVLTITEMLRKHGVVGKFVEFYGPGVSRCAAGQPGDDRQHEPGVRLDRGDVPDRRRDDQVPAADRPPATSRSRWSRPTRRSRASGTTRPPSPTTPSGSRSTSPRSSRRWPGRSARRTGSSLTDAKPAFRTALRDYVAARRLRRQRAGHGGRGVVPGERPARRARRARRATRPRREAPRTPAPVGRARAPVRRRRRSPWTTGRPARSTTAP